MVDDNTREKISHSGKRISLETKSSLSSYNRVKCLESATQSKVVDPVEPPLPSFLYSFIHVLLILFSS
jgi:hypothetical protein